MNNLFTKEDDYEHYLPVQEVDFLYLGDTFADGEYLQYLLTISLNRWTISKENHRIEMQ